VNKLVSLTWLLWAKIYIALHKGLHLCLVMYMPNHNGRWSIEHLPPEVDVSNRLIKNIKYSGQK